MLDMSVRAKILQLMLTLKRDFSLTYVYITHDLATAKFFCDRIAIMYLGKIVEIGPAEEIYANPRHPYTHGLLESIPRLDAPPGERLTPIMGSVSDNIPWTNGCAFAPRCSREVDACREVTPVLVPLAEIAPDRVIAGRRVADALAQLSTEGIQRLPDLD